MSETLTALSRRTSEVALRASGSRIALTQSPGSGVVPRVAWAEYPAPDEDGWATPESGAMLMVVAIHADVRRRTVYLVIDRANAPLTGNYVVEITRGATTESVTYNATSQAPADVDALIAGIVAELLADAGFTAEVTADAYATVPGGDLDCIRLRGTVADATEFASFYVTSNTVFPGGAALVSYAEAEDATDLQSITVYGKPAPAIAASVTSAIGQPYADMVSRWVPIAEPSIQSARLDVSGYSAVTARVVISDPADTYSATTVLAGVYLCPATL